jgi:hypothetical protein
MTMGNPAWPEKLSRALAEHLGASAARKIMAEVDRPAALDEHERAALMAETMDKLDALAPDLETRVMIMTECSCDCYTEHIAEFKKVWAAGRDIDQLLTAMHGKVFMVKPERVGDIVYITKAPRFPEEHRNATTPEAKRYYFCHCDYARAAVDLSPTYCLCGAGWCKKIWEAVLERPVRVEIVKSVLQGDEVCRFAVHL